MSNDKDRADQRDPADQGDRPDHADRHDQGSGPRPGTSAGGQSRDFHEAVERFERAVEDLVGSARGQFADRATAFIDQTTDQLRRELATPNRAAGGPGRSAGGARRSADPVDDDDVDDHRPPRPDISHRRSRYLYRDTSRQRIVGVCAGIAAYYGVEPWVVRIVAVTGLLFLPSIVFPAYWIAYFVLDKGPNGKRRSSRWRRYGYYSHRRHARMNRSSHAPRGSDDGGERVERQQPLTPRGSLRNLSADLTEAELRLRRMESHVTSGQYELQRELAKLDDGEPAAGPATGRAVGPTPAPSL